MSRILLRTITGDFLNTTKVGLAREPASFWLENMIAVVILTTSFSENVVVTEKS